MADGTAMKWVVGKTMAAQRRIANRRARQFTAADAPVLIKAYAAFAENGQSGSPRQPFKGHDLWRILSRAKPRSVVELGSGTTSAVFALYGQRSGAAYVCFEHSQEWAAVTEGCLRRVGLIDAEDSPVRVVGMAVREDKSASGFVEPIPLDADFIYVDGPPCPIVEGRKRPNDDVVRLLEVGGKPRWIVVDGRTETVELILRHPLGEQYTAELSYIYALRHNLWGAALAFREHTILYRRDGGATT